MKINFRMRLSLIAILLILVVGCQVKRPDDLISESKLEKLLYDYHLAKAMGETLPYDQKYKQAVYLDAVFKKYGTTEAEFDSSMVWYARNTEVLAKVYERLNKRMKAQQDGINHLVALRDHKPKTFLPGDSIEVWSMQRLVRLTGADMNRSYAFVIPADSNFKDRDTLIWKANYHFLQASSDSKNRAIMNLQISYQNDSVAHLTRRIVRPGMTEITLFADTFGAIKEVRGFIYFDKPDRKSTATLLVDRLSLMRYHCQDSLSFAARDSVNKVKALKADSLKRKQGVQTIDTVHKQGALEEGRDRREPEELNRKRTGIQTQKRPEQLETEQRIEQEKRQQRLLRMQQNRRPVRR